ncbi:hypothetical protein GCM10023159_01690 [Brevibacterium yomogidense]
MVGKTGPQSAQRRHRDQEVAELQRPQGQHDRSAHQRPLPEAILFDRDDTLIADVPYNGDPDLVAPMPGALSGLERIRALGIPVGVVSNQSGIGRGILTRAQVEAVNARVEQLLGPFDVWEICPHRAEDRCPCRKPAPRMLVDACSTLGVAPRRTVFIGDIGADVQAAAAAGCTGILVPTAVTLQTEVDAAAHVAVDLAAAIDLCLDEGGRS